MGNACCNHGEGRTEVDLGPAKPGKSEPYQASGTEVSMPAPAVGSAAAPPKEPVTVEGVSPIAELDEKTDKPAVRRVSFAVRTESSQPPDDGAGKAFRIEILKASGLDIGSDRAALYCVVEVADKPLLTFQTYAVEPSGDPAWNHEADIDGILSSDTITFSVREQAGSSQKSVARATMRGDTFYSNAFNGELPLVSDANDIKAYLHVKVEVSVPKPSNEMVRQEGADPIVTKVKNYELCLSDEPLFKRDGPLSVQELKDFTSEPLRNR